VLVFLLSWSLILCLLVSGPLSSEINHCYVLLEDLLWPEVALAFAGPRAQDLGLTILPSMSATEGSPHVPTFSSETRKSLAKQGLVTLPIT
jgi:hypothetical protein